MTTTPSGPQGPAVGAVSLMHLLGLVAGGWRSAQAALIDAGRVPRGSSDSFHNAKIANASFYCEHVLVQATSHARIVCGDGASTIAIAALDF